MPWTCDLRWRDDLQRADLACKAGNQLSPQGNQGACSMHKVLVHTRVRNIPPKSEIRGELRDEFTARPPPFGSSPHRGIRCGFDESSLALPQSRVTHAQMQAPPSLSRLPDSDQTFFPCRRARLIRAQDPACPRANNDALGRARNELAAQLSMSQALGGLSNANAKPRSPGWSAR